MSMSPIDPVIRKSKTESSVLVQVCWLVEIHLIKSAELFSDFEDNKIFPAILKQSKFGYDGKGQYHVNSVSETKAVLNDSNENEFVLEKKLNLDKEISVILSRSSDGVSKIFPVIENQHKEGILDLSIIPARVNDCLLYTSPSPRD